MAADAGSPKRTSKKRAAKKRAAATRATKKQATKKRAATKRAVQKQAPRKRTATKEQPETGSGRRPTRAERAEAKREERLRRMRAKAGSRYRIHYDVDGPRVRLGVLWFLGAMIALYGGTVTTTVYFGVVFAAAGSHTLRTWRARGAAVDPRVALLGAALVVLAAGAGPRIMGAAVLVLAVGALVLAARGVGAGDGISGAVARASLVLQSALPVAVAGGCLVLLAGLETWAAISLVVLTSAYESGDYLIGSGAANAFEGPLAGGAAVVVVTLVVAALGVPPFGLDEAVVFGVLVAPGALAGQLIGSVMLPHARAYAPALRRVDSLLLIAPLWYAGVDLLVA